MKRSVRHFSKPRNRRGSILILVLVCCVVGVALLVISLQVSLQQRRQLRSELQLEQTRWVLDAVIRKTIADSPDEAQEVELKPKLEKFDKVQFKMTPEKDNERVVVQARIENHSGTSVTSRSASFELKD